MKKLISLNLVLLICLLIQTQPNFAQTSLNLGVLNGKAKTIVKPEYPETAKKSGVGGSVKINVEVDEQGNVMKAEAVSGELLLLDAALTAARITKFEPYLINSKAVKFSGLLVFSFANSNSLKPDDSKVFEEYLKSSQTDFWGDFTKVQNPKNESETTAKGQNENKCSIGLKDDFYIYNKQNRLEPVSIERVKEIIKTCDEAVKMASVQPPSYYIRGLAHYYLIRGFDKPLIKTLSEIEKVSIEDVRLSIADLQFYIQKQVDFNKKTNYGIVSEELKMAYLATGELLAVSAVKDNNEKDFRSALEQFGAGEKLKTLADGYDRELNRISANDREIINLYLEEASKQSGTQTNPDEIKIRYQKYAADYAAKETVYKQNVQNFQTILKAQQTASTPDNAQICRSLSLMNASYQAMKNSFTPIIEMKNKGELKDVNLLSQIEARVAQQSKVQGSIDGAIAKYGCK